MTSSPATREEAIERALASYGVPTRYLNVPADNSLPNGNAWLYITGNVGSGKTYKAAGILRSYAESRLQAVGNGKLWLTPKARFITASGYLAEVKKGFDGEGIAKSVLNTPLLVIDDLGQEVPTQWACAELFELIAHRYAEELRTVITSQFSIGDIGRRLAENGGKEQGLALASRLAGECIVKKLGDKDRRLA